MVTHRNGCPAIGKTCKRCGKPNHFARFYKSRKPPRKRVDTNQIKTENNDEYESDEKKSVECHTIFASHINDKSCMNKPYTKIFVNIARVIKFLVDTGSAINIIDECNFKALSYDDNVLSKSSIDVYF